METLSQLATGFLVALTPINLLWAAIGVTLGTAISVLPGIGPALTVALLLPLTFQLEPVAAFIMFAGIYYGAMYGGSTTSILLNTPGESATIITAVEGNLMARKGRGAAALATAAIGSFVAGTLATIALSFVAPSVVELALLFGPAEYFALMVLAFITVSALLGASAVRGLAALFLGLGLGLIGIDLQTGQARFTTLPGITADGTFGLVSYPQLLDGIGVIIVVVGLFAVGETLFVASRYRWGEQTINPLKGSIWMTREEWRRSWKPWLRGTAIGFPIGAMPAGGSEVPTFLSYFAERRLTKHPEEFGKGAIEGVAGPEAANNAAAAGVLVPLLALGLPTSATAAIMLAAFQSYGLQPGPLLFETRPDLVWGLIASLYIGNVMLLILNLPMAGVWVRLLLIPQPYLYAGILVFATLGVYSLNQSLFDLGILWVIGIVGYGMRRFDFPVAPTVVGLILGPLAEQQFRRAMSISQGDATVFLTQPIAASLLAIAAAVLLVPPALRLIKRLGR
ncbi:MAG: tripartite tricarboxylate transporter permease [Alphaproteobacteria bacterium]|nr:tripartite tricarboxylate transporter permease [Alphaproteobacteria bacterium]